MSETSTKALAARFVASRTYLVAEYPFFGRLLLHLPFGFAECGTAYTDMRRVVFDPGFAQRLDDDALRFVLLHEVMHCVLGHCTRGGGKQHRLYNIAADIVINSMLLDMLGLDSMKVDGDYVMHMAPNGREGRDYSADEVYDMLMRLAPNKRDTLACADTLDDHSVWEECVDRALGDRWRVYAKEALRVCGSGSGIPDGVARALAAIRRAAVTDWRTILHDFIRHHASDYSFTRPDTRYSGDIILPSFMHDVSGAAVDDIWFLIDTSGSVRDGELALAYSELGDAIAQLDRLRGKLSFFDCEVSEPIPFESAGELHAITPVGGGGTSFGAVFDALGTYFNDGLPTAMVIITDGCAAFPDESAAMGVPVIWLFVGSNMQAPWGVSVHIESA